MKVNAVPATEAEAPDVDVLTPDAAVSASDAGVLEPDEGFFVLVGFLVGLIKKLVGRKKKSKKGEDISKAWKCKENMSNQEATHVGEYVGEILTSVLVALDSVVLDSPLKTGVASPFSSTKRSPIQSAEQPVT
jgi:hypothetical protein